MKSGEEIRISVLIDLSEKAKEYLKLSTSDGDEMEIMALGYLEKIRWLAADIQEEVCDNDY